MTSQNWQGFLESLTNSARDRGVLKEMKHRNETDLAKLFLRRKDLRSQLVEWLKLCLKDTVGKSSTSSRDYRILGNDKFKAHQDEACLSLYTDSVRVAPVDSEEFALALANRSAVLFHLCRYEECATDAKLALSGKYPDALRHKLLLRLSRCWFRLRRWEDCENTVYAVRNLISEECDMPENKRKEVAKEVESLLCDIRHQQGKRNCDVTKGPSLDQTLPQPHAGQHVSFPSASAALELRFKPDKGRYVVAREKIKQGDIIFVEKPYAFVVLPDQYKTHCHNCCSAIIAPIPCDNCTDALFCTKACSLAANSSYHRWECGGLKLMSAVGIAHLSLRVVLVTAPPSEIAEKACAAAVACSVNENNLGSGQDHYASVYSLLTHLKDMSQSDVFQYTMTAMLLTLYLLHNTTYFTGLGGAEMEDLAESASVVQVFALILRHLLQLVCNAHAISKLDSDLSYGGVFNNKVVSETQQRVATAIYPSASMMNHSCDPNIVNSFFREVLIVKASRDIPAGSEVFNCYGPHFQRMATTERQAALLAQYFFLCDCSACSASPGEAYDPLHERLSALRCPICSGPLMELAPGREPAGSKIAQNETANAHHMVCGSCGTQQPISRLVVDAFSAHALYRQGCDAFEGGNLQEALRCLHQCRELQERSLYKSNRDLTATLDHLAKCYAMLGEYSESAAYLQRVLPAVEEQFGTSSVEVANELQKLSDVLLCDLRQMRQTPPKEKVTLALEVVERSQKILTLHYGEWNSGWQELQQKLEEIKVMDAAVAIHNTAMD